MFFYLNQLWRDKNFGRSDGNVTPSFFVVIQILSDILKWYIANIFTKILFSEKIKISKCVHVLENGKEFLKGAGMRDINCGKAALI
jgi:hypothetical protein